MSAPTPRSSRHERRPRVPGAQNPGDIKHAGRALLADPVEEWKRRVRSVLADAVVADARHSSLKLRITPGFVMLALLLGARHGLVGSVATLAVLSSVLLAHELSRAGFARVRGRSSRVDISAAGGRAEVSGPPFQGADAILFAVIGSAANAMVASIAFGVTRTGMVPEATMFLRGFVFCHTVWAGAQLLPIVPFRAGTAIASRLSPSVRFAHAALSCMVLTTLFVVVWARMTAPLLLGVVAVSAMASKQLMSEGHRESTDAHSGVDAIIRDAEARLSEGAPVEAAQLAERGLAVAQSARMREKLWKALAWARIGQQDPFRAHGALLQLPAQSVDLHLLAAYLGCCNRVDEAEALLQEARSQGHRAPETTKLLADLLFRRGDRKAVLALAESDEEPLSAEDRRAIAAAVASEEA